MEGGGRNAPGPKSYVFLKCEGHTASHPMHLKSFYVKLKTGEGDIANPALNRLAKTRKDLGIKSRAAENYSKAYGKLLKDMGFEGKTTTVAQAMGRMYTTCTGYIAQLKPNRQADIGPIVRKAGFPYPLTSAHIEQLPNNEGAKFLTAVVEPLMQVLAFGDRGWVPPQQARPFVVAYDNAKDDLKRVVKSMKNDQASSLDASTARYFEEIVVDPVILDIALEEFRAQLTGR
jgi:hypothetical protein